MARSIRILVFALLLAPAAMTSALANTYYIAANGSDSNDGASKTTPWMHAPGMTNCTGNCGSTTPAPGDTFIFRGGDTWHEHAASGSPVGLPWIWSWSGAAGKLIYVGVDKTWFAGSSFARPILNEDNPLSTSTVSSCRYDDQNVNTAMFDGASYITFDGFEFTGKCWSGAQDPNTSSFTFNGTHVVVENLYFHGWTVQSGFTYDDHASIAGGIRKGDTSNICQYNVFDGSDSTYGTTGSYPSGKATGFAIRNACGVVAFSVFNRVSNGLISSTTSVHDCLFHDLYEPQGSQHGNIWNSNNDNLINLGPQSFYNNVTYNINEGVGTWLMPSGNVAYIFNNVSWNQSNSSNCFLLGGGTPATTAYIYNNTFDSPCNVRALNNGFDPVWNGTIFFQNNHYIGYSPASISSTYSCDSGARCTFTDNGNEVFQSESVANGQGYDKADFYAPTSANDATLGVAANDTNLCRTFSADLALCSGTSRGVTEQPGSGGLVATSPAISPVARPASGAWAAGAYELPGGPAPLKPPTNLTAIVE